MNNTNIERIGIINDGGFIKDYDEFPENEEIHLNDTCDEVEDEGNVRHDLDEK